MNQDALDLFIKNELQLKTISEIEKTDNMLPPIRIMLIEKCIFLEKEVSNLRSYTSQLEKIIQSQKIDIARLYIINQENEAIHLKYQEIKVDFLKLWSYFECLSQNNLFNKPADQICIQKIHELLINIDNNISKKQIDEISDLKTKIKNLKEEKKKLLEEIQKLTFVSSSSKQSTELIPIQSNPQISEQTLTKLISLTQLLCEKLNNQDYNQRSVSVSQNQCNFKSSNTLQVSSLNHRLSSTSSFIQLQSKIKGIENDDIVIKEQPQNPMFEQSQFLMIYFKFSSPYKIFQPNQRQKPIRIMSSSGLKQNNTLKYHQNLKTSDFLDLFSIGKIHARQKQELLKRGYQKHLK